MNWQLWPQQRFLFVMGLRATSLILADYGLVIANLFRISYTIPKLLED
jgi:hypothetical protein